MSKRQSNNWFKKVAISTLIAFAFSITAIAEDKKTPDVKTVDPTEEKQQVKLTEEILTSLITYVELQTQLRKDIKSQERSLKLAQTETEKVDLTELLDKTKAKLQDTSKNIEDLAANTDLGLLRVAKEPPFNLQRELFSLLEPALKEMKHATSDVRLKSQIREKILYYEQRVPVLQEAIGNVSALDSINKNRTIKTELTKMNKAWSEQLAFTESELQAKKLQLEKIELQEKNLEKNKESVFKNFFERRGWTLIQALFAILGVLILSRLVHFALSRSMKGYRAEHRGVQFRIIDIGIRVATVLFIIIAPMIIFYIEEDWVLFSLGLLLLIGMSWTLRHAIPRYWGQLELFLNVGPVREGERLMLDGIPWKVKYINMYSVLENPIAELSQRVDIDDLVDMRSRPINDGEPWFPCKRGDWVILKDGVRGKVIGISIEMIQLIQRGGAVSTYNLSDFLSLSPKNLSKSFRIKETIGISYRHQKESTSSIVQKLEAIIKKRAVDEDYEDIVQSIRVEFEHANDSSLDLVVIADFKGSSADIYNRLRRAIQRWCVDACTENDWEIPFPQLTLHSEAEK